MKTLLNYAIGFVMGAAFMFIYLMGHMMQHDAMYHTPGSKFGTQGVMPLYQPSQNVVTQQVEIETRK